MGQSPPSDRASRVARRVGSSIDDRTGSFSLSGSPEKQARVVRPFSRPRATIVIAKGGACWALPRPGSGPGLGVVKWNLPASSARDRPKAGRRSSAGGSTCHSSTAASVTGLPSPSKTVPVSTTRLRRTESDQPIPGARSSVRRVPSSGCWWRQACSALHRHSLTAAQHDVPAVFRFSHRHVECADEAVTRRLVRDRQKDRSRASKGSPGKYICVTRRWAKPDPKNEKRM
jgi:hypothetical protein